MKEKIKICIECKHYECIEEIYITTHGGKIPTLENYCNRQNNEIDVVSGKELKHIRMKCEEERGLNKQIPWEPYSHICIHKPYMCGNEGIFFEEK